MCRGVPESIPGETLEGTFGRISGGISGGIPGKNSRSISGRNPRKNLECIEVFLELIVDGTCSW